MTHDIHEYGRLTALSVVNKALHDLDVIHDLLILVLSHGETLETLRRRLMRIDGDDVLCSSLPADVDRVLALLEDALWSHLSEANPGSRIE